MHGPPRWRRLRGRPRPGPPPGPARPGPSRSTRRRRRPAAGHRARPRPAGGRPRSPVPPPAGPCPPGPFPSPEPPARGPPTPGRRTVDRAPSPACGGSTPSWPSEGSASRRPSRGPSVWGWPNSGRRTPMATACSTGTSSSWATTAAWWWRVGPRPRTWRPRPAVWKRSRVPGGCAHGAPRPTRDRCPANRPSGPRRTRCAPSTGVAVRAGRRPNPLSRPVSSRVDPVPTRARPRAPRTRAGGARTSADRPAGSSSARRAHRPRGRRPPLAESPPNPRTSTARGRGRIAREPGLPRGAHPTPTHDPLVRRRRRSRRPRRSAAPRPNARLDLRPRAAEPLPFMGPCRQGAKALVLSARSSQTISHRLVAPGGVAAPRRIAANTPRHGALPGTPIRHDIACELLADNTSPGHP